MEEITVVWSSEERALTLEGEPVLKYSLSWPRVEGAGLGGRWISRYYARLADRWRRRWEREVYWPACLELAARREAARPFTPWTGELSGSCGGRRFSSGTGRSACVFSAVRSGGTAGPPGYAGGMCGSSGRERPSPCGRSLEKRAGKSGCGRPLSGRGRSAERRGTAFWTATGSKRRKKSAPSGAGA